MFYYIITFVFLKNILNYLILKYKYVFYLLNIFMLIVTIKIFFTYYSMNKDELHFPLLLFIDFFIIFFTKQSNNHFDNLSNKFNINLFYFNLDLKYFYLFFVFIEIIFAYLYNLMKCNYVYF